MDQDNKGHRPTFLTSYLGALRSSAHKRSWRAVIPFWIIAALATGAALTYFISPTFWSDENWDVSTTVFAGIMTFNGLILAISWSSFSKIYEIIGGGRFCAYLKTNELLNSYITYVGYVHAAQIFAVIVSGLGLILLLLDLGSIWADKSVLALVIAATIYAIKQASATIIGMHDLIWQKAIFEEHFIEREDNVVSMERADEK